MTIVKSQCLSEEISRYITCPSSYVQATDASPVDNLTRAKKIATTLARNILLHGIHEPGSVMLIVTSRDVLCNTIADLVNENHTILVAVTGTNVSFVKYARASWLWSVMQAGGQPFMEIDE